MWRVVPRHECQAMLPDRRCLRRMNWNYRLLKRGRGDVIREQPRAKGIFFGLRWNMRTYRVVSCRIARVLHLCQTELALSGLCRATQQRGVNATCCKLLQRHVGVLLAHVGLLRPPLLL